MKSEMKLAILSRAPRIYSTRRLYDAAKERGHEVHILNTTRFNIDLSPGSPNLQYRGKSLPYYDAILPRIGASITYFGTVLVRQFQQLDVYTPNTANGISNSRDKLRAMQMLSRHDIGMPNTTYVSDSKDVQPAIARVGGAPVVIKLLRGTHGIGVMLARDRITAEAMLQTLQSSNIDTVLQQFVPESSGRDLRAFVVGDQVVAAMRRIAAGDEFRSNLHRGGRSEVVEVTDEQEQAAVRSARIMGLRVAGVDMLESNSGPLILEVNSSPGLRGIETATGIDVAGKIIDYISNQVTFPELDVRERLTVSTGYGVAELLVRDDSEFVGHTVKEAGLRDREITILTLHRGPQVIPHPPKDCILQANDRLLCFGNKEEMRGLMSPLAQPPRHINILPE